MSEQPIPIYTHYDFYVPAFELKVRGQDLERNIIRDVLSVTYTDSLDKLDSCQITINNWDAESRDFKYSDPGPSGGIFDPGTEVELYMGYIDSSAGAEDSSGLTLMLRGTIVALSPNFPAGGQPTLQVRALNQLYKLHFKQDTQVFENKTDTQIAQAIVDKIVQDQSRQRSQGGQSALDLSLDTGNLSPNDETEHDGPWRSEDRHNASPPAVVDSLVTSSGAHLPRPPASSLAAAQANARRTGGARTIVRSTDGPATRRNE